MLSLICPYCKKKLTVELMQNGFGTATCLCEEYPILENIYYLQKDDTLLNRHLLKFIERKQYFRAIYKALSHSTRTYRLVTFGNYILFKLLGKAVPLQNILSLLRWLGPARNWFLYLLNRNKRQDIHFALRYVLYALTNQDILLDVGCGVGNLLHLYTKIAHNPSFRYIGIDKNFFSMLLFRIYNTTSTSLYICGNVEDGLPLHSHALTQVLFLDSFWQIHHKERVLNESQRVLRKGGCLSIIGMYETTDKTYYWGYGTKMQYLHSLLATRFRNIRFMTLEMEKSTKVMLTRKNQREIYSCLAVRV